LDRVAFQRRPAIEPGWISEEHDARDCGERAREHLRDRLGNAGLDGVARLSPANKHEVARLRRQMTKLPVGLTRIGAREDRGPGHRGASTSGNGVKKVFSAQS